MVWDIPKSGLKTANRNMEKFCSEIKQPNCCSFRMLKWVKGKRNRREMQWHDEVGAACHYNMSLGYHPHLVITANYKRERHKENMDCYLSYLDWLINKSPWRSAFLTKDVEKAYDVGVITTTGVAGNVLGGACIAQRQIYETNYFQQINIWYALVKKGLPPNLAFVVAYLGNSNNELTYIKWNHSAGGHDPIDSYRISHTAVRNFMDGYMPKSRVKPPHIECNSHRGVFDSWGGQDGSFRAWWMNNCEQGRKEVEVWGKKKLVDMSDFDGAVDAAFEAANKWLKSEEFMGDV